jgi:hypothetical protein
MRQTLMWILNHRRSFIRPRTPLRPAATVRVTERNLTIPCKRQQSKEKSRQRCDDYFRQADFALLIRPTSSKAVSGHLANSKSAIRALAPVAFAEEERTTTAIGYCCCCSVSANSDWVSSRNCDHSSSAANSSSGGRTPCEGVTRTRTCN